MNDRFLRACNCEPVDRTPIWLMRQAGRFLPEYRALRSKYDMLTMCRTPELAVQVTLQPLTHFDLDAAILFSDIMIPLQGMGIQFDIQEGVGPIIANPVRSEQDVEALRVVNPEEDVPFVGAAVSLLRKELDEKLPLIGFAGAPFTLASYIVEGKPSRDFARTKVLMHSSPSAWHALMDKLAQSVSAFLLAQVRAGAQAVQLFDSWVGTLSPQDYAEFVLPYSSQVLETLASTGVPRIHFGTGTATLLELFKQAGSDVIGLDWRVPLDVAWRRLGDVALQGNLDPVIMLTSPDVIKAQARLIMDQARMRNGHVFNLGHGVLPNTPVENVQELVNFVHAYSTRGNGHG